MKMFEAEAKIYADLGEGSWAELGNGELRVLYDSEIFGAKIVFEADNTGELITETVISMDTQMKVI